MKHFVYGEETYLAKRKVQKLLSGFNPLEITSFDDTNSVEDMVLSIQTLSLFCEKKAFLFKNIKAFTHQEEATEIVKILKKLEKPGLLVFWLEGSVGKQTNPLCSYLLQTAQTCVFEPLNQNEISNWIMGKVKKENGSITPDALQTMVVNLPSSLSVVSLELQKILWETKNITKAIVQKSVTRYVENNYFALPNAIVQKDRRNIIQSYQNQVQNGDDPVFIIAQIAAVFTLALRVNLYKKQGFSVREIATKTNVHVFRVKNAVSIINTYSEPNIAKFTHQLSLLDQQIKKGLADKHYGLKQFLLHLIA